MAETAQQIVEKTATTIEPQPGIVYPPTVAPVTAAVAPTTVAVTRTLTLPGSPVDKQMIILTDSLTAPTWEWAFIYNAGSASAYKWEFVGGAPRFASVITEESPSGSGSWTNLATDGPSITLPASIGGDFNVVGHATAANSAGSIQACSIGVTVGNTTPSILTNGNHFNGDRTSKYVEGEILSIASAGVIKLRYLASASVAIGFGQRYLRVTPKRIG